jgi:tetratricopeptide (TPR) repeat protein
MRTVPFLLFMLTIAVMISSSSPTTFTTGAKAQQQVQYRKRYTCNGDVLIVGYCRHDSDQPEFPRTTPEKDYCQVVYPDRPPQGGIQVTTVELLGDIVKKLQACGAFNPPGTNPPQRQQQTPPAQSSTQPRTPATTTSSSSSGMTAQQYFDLGSKYMGAKDYEKALDAFKKSIAIAPSSDAYDALGDAHYLLEENDDALDAYLKAVQLNRNNSEAHYGLGITYSTLGIIDKSIASLREAVRLNPKATGARSELAHSYFLNGQFAESAQEYQTVLAANRDTKTGYRLGFLLLLNRQRAQAMRVYQTMPPADPYAERLKDALDDDAKGGPAKALVSYGDYSLMDDDPIESLAGYRNALKFNPTDPRVLLDIASGLGANREHDEARKVYQTVIAAKPHAEMLSAAHYGLGSDYLELKQYAPAVVELKESVRIDPSSFPPRLDLGKAYAQLNQLNEALAQFKQAEALSEKDAYKMTQVGMAYVDAKQFQRAEATYNNALRINPKYDYAYFYLGKMYNLMHRKPDAMKAYAALKPLDAKLAEKLLKEINQTSASQ